LLRALHIALKHSSLGTAQIPRPDHLRTTIILCAPKLSQSVSHRRESGGTERPIYGRWLRGRRKRLWNPVCHVGYPEMTRSTTYATGNASGSAPDSVSARRKRRSVCDDTSHREHGCEEVLHDRVPYSDGAAHDVQLIDQTENESPVYRPCGHLDPGSSTSEQCRLAMSNLGQAQTRLDIDIICNEPSVLSVCRRRRRLTFIPDQESCMVTENEPPRRASRWPRLAGWRRVSSPSDAPRATVTGNWAALPNSDRRSSHLASR
jgi:hypothetical protein